MQNSFQKLLLDFSLAGSLRSTPESLIQLFLRSTREFFGVQGAYFWRKIAPDVLVGEEADGHMAEQFRGTRLNPGQSAVTCEAARSSRTVFRNEIEGSRYPMAAEYHACSLMAAPLVVAGDVVGTVVFLNTEDARFFNEDMAAKATILAGQLGSLLEAQRLYAMADARAQELHQLLEISSELGGSSQLDEFLKKFVVRAAQFLGFGRSYIALLEGESCQVRWVAESGEAHPLEVSFPADAAARVLGSAEVFWTDDIRQVAEADQKSAAEHNVRQVLTVPLLSSEGRTLGMFGVLDRLDQAGISAEDIRRARALAAPVAVALEAARNLHLSKEHGRRAEDLMAMALELNSLLRLPEFAQSFTARAAEMLGAKSAALALAQRSHLEVVAVRTPETVPEKGVLRRLAVALGDVIADRKETITAGHAVELLGHVAVDLQWEDVVLACLHGGDAELVGILCLANRGKPVEADDRNLLQALAGHASVALENARLFTRMDQANRHWMEIFDAISDFIVVHDAQHKVLRVNRSMADFIGVRPGELVGISMRALLATTEQPGPQPCPFCRPGAEAADEFIHPVLERTYLVSTSRIHGPNNEGGLQTIHVLKDISDRQEAERRYRELFDNIQEGLYFTSTEGRFIEVNDALVRMLGYGSRDELLQVDIPSQVYFDPRGRERFRARMEETGVVRNYEETLRRKDGAPIHTLQNSFAVRDAQGKVTQFRGLILDITELKNSQAELQRERDFNNKILNNTQSIILVSDTAGQVTYANRRWYESGAYNPQQWLGQPLAEMVVPARRAHLEAALEATLAGQQVDNLELPITRADGRAGQFSVNLSPMRDEQGEVSSIVVVMTDISDAAMMHSKLMHAEKMAAVGQLVSGVAHEVNNPLTAILGFADLLMENSELPESARKDLRVILQEAQRTKQIVQNLLSFARQMPPQRKPVQVNSILRRTLQLRAYDFSSHGVEVSERFYELLPEVVGDPHQLQQVFLNILNNAYDAVRDIGRPARIEIETSTTGGWVQVLFRDNGNGISNPDRIFDPFFTTKEVGKGTGLGLSICYGILREHGGEITCHNNAGQEGATFLVRLPLSADMTETIVAAGAMQT